MSMSQGRKSDVNALPSADVLRHVVDVHCHPTDTSPIPASSMQNLSITICAMSSMESDQSRVKDLASRYPEKVVPCFGQYVIHCISDPRPRRNNQCAHRGALVWQALVRLNRIHVFY